jgi:AraC-like DNA-binding protein
MRRRLKLEKASFRELSDQVFRELANTLVSGGDSVDIIAEKMGYADARSFRRNFQRVFGLSPSELRKRIQADQSQLSPFN